MAEQAADEYRHYALIKDYLTGRGAADDIPAEAYDGYFGQFLTGDVRAFACATSPRSPRWCSCST